MSVLFTSLHSEPLLHVFFTSGFWKYLPFKFTLCLDPNRQFYQRSQTYNSSDTTEKNRADYGSGGEYHLSTVRCWAAFYQVTPEGMTHTWERLYTITQAFKNNSEDVSITRNQSALIFSRDASKVVALQLNGWRRWCETTWAMCLHQQVFFFSFLFFQHGNRLRAEQGSHQTYQILTQMAAQPIRITAGHWY